MALSSNLVTKTFMNLEIFLQKAAALDIFEALIFNYNVKMELLDPLVIHFLAIVTELANQLQILCQETSEQKEFLRALEVTVSNSDLVPRKSAETLSQSNDPVLLSVKTEHSRSEDDPLSVSLYDAANNITEIHVSNKNSSKTNTLSPKEGGNTPTKLKQKSPKSSLIKKNENKIKLEKEDTSSEILEDQEINDSFKCDSCECVFPTETKLLSHHTKCQNDASVTAKPKSRASRTHKCNHCDLVFTARKFLTTHINRSHKVGNDTNEETSNGSCIVFEDSVLGLGEEVLPENLPFLCCVTCFLVFRTHTEFELHNCKNGVENLEEGTVLHNYIQLAGRQLITNLEKLKTFKKFKCGLCHEEYRSFARMSYHLPRCTQGPYKCELCGEEYMFKKDLNLHKKKLHRGANSFFCDECGLTFKFRTSLQKHKVNRHETEQSLFSCDECGKDFAKRIQLTNHKINTHRIERKFLCQICGNKFSNNGSLIAHLDTHTEIRKFTCGYCNKKFRQKEKLKFHTRIHTGERPHLCQTCGKGFIRKSKLDEHMRRHRGEKRYHCSKCNKSYAAGWDLKLHNKKQHPETIVPSAGIYLKPVSSVHLTSVNQNKEEEEEEDDDDDDPDNPLPISVPNEENESVTMTTEQSKLEDGLEQVNLNSVQADSHALVNRSSPDASRSRILVNLNQQQTQQDNQLIVQSDNASSTNSGILVQLNAQNTSVTQGDVGNSNSRILVHLDPSQLQNQSLILNGNTNNSNSKIIVQLDSSEQQHQQQTQSLPQSNNANDSNASRILLQLDSSHPQNAQTALIPNSVTNNSRILLQIDNGQNPSLPPNTILTVADAIHLAPLVDDMNNVNLGNVTAQYIQLTSSQPHHSVSSNSALTSSNNVPLHIQLPVSAVQVPLSAISQQGNNSTAYELQSLSGQAGLVFTSAGFDVGSITY